MLGTEPGSLEMQPVLSSPLLLIVLYLYLRKKKRKNKETLLLLFLFSLSIYSTTMVFCLLSLSCQSNKSGQDLLWQPCCQSCSLSGVVTGKSQRNLKCCFPLSSGTSDLPVCIPTTSVGNLLRVLCSLLLLPLKQISFSRLTGAVSPGQRLPPFLGLLEPHTAKGNYSFLLPTAWPIMTKQDAAEAPPSYILAEAILGLTRIWSPWWRIP